MNYQLTRRQLLGGIVTTSIGLAYAGTVSGAAGTRYVAVGDRVGARLEAAGYTVQHELAGGSVALAFAGADELDDIASVDGVSAVAPDVRLAMTEPVLDGGTQEEVDAPAFYNDFLWDKQTIESIAANELATGAGASVAVIDTGIDYAHPELAPNVDADAGRLFREGAVRSGVGEVVVPDDYADPTELTITEFHVADEQQGHGTHVAGIAAAAGGGGVIGTAPDATLVSLRVFWWTMVEDPETGEEEPGIVTTTGDVLTAIDHAAAHGYDAANLSLGTAPIHPSLMRDEGIRSMRIAFERVVNHAVRRGTVVVASAGNSETNLGRQGLFSLPNSVEGAVSVSATGPNDLLTFYSDYGTSEVDVGAPGGGYETLEKTLIEDPAEVEWPFPSNLVLSTTSERVEGGAYGWKAGTSMAAPQVAGLVALVRELDPDATPRQVESHVKGGAELATGRSDEHLGAGRINARRTVERL